MTDPLSLSNEIKLCTSNSYSTEEWKQIKNEITLSEDGHQLKNEFAMLGDGNHISENSSLVNLVTVIDGDGEMQRIPSENALLPGLASDPVVALAIENEKIHFSQQTANLAKLSEGKSNENASLIDVNMDFSNMDTELIGEDVDLIKCPNKGIDKISSSMDSLNYSVKSSLTTINSKLSVTSINLVNVPLQRTEGDSPENNTLEGLLSKNESKESVDSSEPGNHSSCFSQCFPFRWFYSITKRRNYLHRDCIKT